MRSFHWVALVAALAASGAALAAESTPDADLAITEASACSVSSAVNELRYVRAQLDAMLSQR